MGRGPPQRFGLFHPGLDTNGLVFTLPTYYEYNFNTRGYHCTFSNQTPGVTT